MLTPGPPPSTAATRYWRARPDGRVECTLCPRLCRLREGQSGFCAVRACAGGRVVLTAYGQVEGFTLRPIEARGLHHFLPGTLALSFRTRGDNLADTPRGERARGGGPDCDAAAPPFVSSLARQLGARTVALAEGEPVVVHEYALDVARACRPQGLRTVTLGSGYVCAEPRAELYAAMDAAVVRLDSVSEPFQGRRRAGRLAPVLDTLRYLAHETATWLEVAATLWPGENDADTEIERLAGWIAAELGPDVPLQLGAAAGALEALPRARRVARACGLRHVYLAGVRDPDGQSTHCARCGERLIGRDGDAITEWALDENGACARCGTRLPGRFEPHPPRRLGLRARGREAGARAGARA